MEINNQDLTTFPTPPPIIRTLVRGFNTVANNIYLIILPIILDVFLWLGPQVKANIILDPFYQLIKDSGAPIPADFTTIFKEFSTGLNLLTVIRTFPVGVFSLFSTSLATQTPIGAKTALDMASISDLVLLLFCLNIAGILLGSIYFFIVSRTSLPEISRPSFLKSTLNVFLMNIIWMLIFFVLNIPISIIIVLISQLGDPIRTILTLILVVPAAWLILFYFYSFFPLFTSTGNVISALKQSWRGLRFGIPTLGWFSMLALVITQGMDILWKSAPETSWMAGVGIFGHSFISTGLLAACFIYFYETSIWIEKTLEWFANKQRSNTLSN